MINRAGAPFFTTIEILFMASMIGLDFAWGLVVGPILSAAGITEFVRLDMIVPVMMMLVTRLVVDRFGTLIVYEIVWGILAVLAKPASFGIPGFFKLIPALAYGIILDTLMTLLRNRRYARLMAAAVIGGVVNQFAFLGIRVLFGFPWSTVVQMLLGITLVTTAAVNAVAAHLAFLVWNGVERSGWARRIQAWRSS
jgi:hypothetical protein